MAQLVFDESMIEQLEELYRTRDVQRRRQLVRAALGAQPGERILDIGCGPGFYVAELLDQVGAQGAVVGVDASTQMLGVAARRCEGRPNVAFHEGDAASLPVADESFDAALCVQVLEYVTKPAVALAEMHRVLKPGGRLVVWDVDWATVSWHSTDPARMARALRAWDEHLTDPSLPRTLTRHLRGAGFADVGVEGHVFATNELSPETYGGASLGLIEKYLAGAGGLGLDEAKAWADEQRALGARGEFYFACIQFCFTAKRGADRPGS
jgi:arsenite methyltransferase